MKALYTAATGMSAQQAQLDNIANNLANVNTTGYKRSALAFQDLYYQELTGGGVQGEAQGMVQMGSGCCIIFSGRSFLSGMNNIRICSGDHAAAKCDCILVLSAEI